MPHSPDANPEDLGRSFQSLLREGVWQLDAEPPADTSDASPPPGPRRPAARLAAPVPEPPPLPRILEAMLFLGGVPLTSARAAEVIRGLTEEQFQATLDELNRAYRAQGRPYALMKEEGGYLLALRPNFRFVLEKLAGGVRQARLSTAAVEVLAVVVYRQPVTKQEVDSLRGHESGALLRQLLRRGLITVVSRAESGGRDVQYGTTPRFLDVFGLTNLDDLPQTEDVQRL